MRRCTAASSAASTMSAPPVQVAGVGLAAPASTDDAVANRISESITSDVVPAGRRVITPRKGEKTELPVRLEIFETP